jgi:hypothetical protein
MQRRKYLAALGSLAAGGAAMTGTGAFSVATVPDRGVTVQVADTDEAGGIGLVPGQTQIAYMNNGGELEIDLSKGMRSSADGMNPNSTYYLGGKYNENLNYEEKIEKSDLSSNVFERPLFSIKNQTVEKRRVQIDIELLNAPSGASVTAFAWQYSGVQQAKVLEVDNNNTTDSGAQFNLSPGHKLDVVMIVESGTDPGDIEVNMTVTANAQR